MKRKGYGSIRGTILGIATVQSSESHSSHIIGVYTYLYRMHVLLTVHYVFRLPAFKKLSQKIQDVPEFGAWLQQGTPEQCVPQLWEEEKQLSPVGSAMYQLLVIQVWSSFKYPASEM
jgi:dynein heavy chain 1